MTKKLPLLHHLVTVTVTVPGSKSITQRALVAAALADGVSTLTGPLASEDTAYASQALRIMGVEVLAEAGDFVIKGTGGRVLAPEKDIYLGNNGTATRFLTSVSALAESGLIRITGDRRMEERPIAPLLDALAGWGVKIRSSNNTGCPPLTLEAGGIHGGATTLPEGKSSQYLSSLLLVAPYAAKPAELFVRGRVYSKPYVTMTLKVMAEFGIDVDADDDLRHFRIPQGVYRARSYPVEGDASSASYFWAAAAVTGSTVTVTNVPWPSLQGDAVLVDLLERMGCAVERSGAGITVQGPERLTGIDVDMGDCPDVVPTLAVVAARAHGRTRISNIGHLRIKECDRLHVMATELARVGCVVEELADSLIIEGCEKNRPLNGRTIPTHNDHRIAMSFAVAGLFIPGITIENPGCVVKSFPDFWERWAVFSF